MGGMLPTVGTGREASASPRAAGRHRVQGAGRAGREMGRKRAGSFQARHSQRITPAPQECWPGKAGPVPSVPMPSVAIPTAPRGRSPGSQAAPRLCRVIYFHQLPGHFSLRQDHT